MIKLVANQPYPQAFHKRIHCFLSKRVMKDTWQVLLLNHLTSCGGKQHNVIVSSHEPFADKEMPHVIFTFYFLLQSSLKYSVRSNHNQVHWSPSFSFHPKYGQCFYKTLLFPFPPPTPFLNRAKMFQFFLLLGESYFLLLEYQRSRGMPMEGSVITPNAAQSK